MSDRIIKGRLLLAGLFLLMPAMSQSADPPEDPSCREKLTSGNGREKEGAKILPFNSGRARRQLTSLDSIFPSTVSELREFLVREKTFSLPGLRKIFPGAFGLVPEVISELRRNPAKNSDLALAQKNGLRALGVIVSEDELEALSTEGLWTTPRLTLRLITDRHMNLRPGALRLSNRDYLLLLDPRILGVYPYRAFRRGSPPNQGQALRDVLEEVERNGTPLEYGQVELLHHDVQIPTAAVLGVVFHPLAPIGRWQEASLLRPDVFKGRIEIDKTGFLDGAHAVRFLAPVSVADFVSLSDPIGVAELLPWTIKGILHSEDVGSWLNLVGSEMKVQWGGWLGREVQTVEGRLIGVSHIPSIGSHVLSLMFQTRDGTRESVFARDMIPYPILHYWPNGERPGTAAISLNQLMRSDFSNFLDEAQKLRSWVNLYLNADGETTELAGD